MFAGLDFVCGYFIKNVIWHSETISSKWCFALDHWIFYEWTMAFRTWNESRKSYYTRFIWIHKYNANIIIDSRFSVTFSILYYSNMYWKYFPFPTNLLSEKHTATLKRKLTLECTRVVLGHPVCWNVPFPELFSSWTFHSRRMGRADN